MNRLAKIALIFLSLLAAISLLLPFLPFQSPRKMNLKNQFAAPHWSWGNQGWDRSESEELTGLDRFLSRGRGSVFGNFQFGSWFGTDSKGRDLLSRVAWGSRVSLLVGLVSALVSLVIGVSYGALSGYLGGRWDDWMMRVVDGLYSLPFIFLVIFLLGAFQGYRAELASWGVERIHIFYLVIGLVYWLSMARVVRGQILSLKEKEFIEAARSVGTSPVQIVLRHLLPNVLPVILVYLTLTIPQVMLFESFLSFLGLGIEPPNVSWGLLASDGLEAINPVQSSWWIILFPSLVIGLTLLSLNRLGDGLRDHWDPKHG